MKIGNALIILTGAAVAAFVMFLPNLACAEQPNPDVMTAILNWTEPAPGAFVLPAQYYGRTSRRNRLWNEVYGSSLGINPDYGTYNIYGPSYDQTGGYYGSLSRYCDWNTLYPFCYDYSDNFYLNR